jgi:hypothetical protein|nr:MAG TPA: Protein of unknown function (DUF551) [Caudoviricetes sp.]
MSDYISREAFKKKYLCCGFLPEMSEEEFDSFPAADVEPVRHWIPRSERMPEELEPVNVILVNHRPEPYYGKIKDVPQKATAVYYRKKWYWWSCVCEDLLAEYGRNEPDLVDSGIEITHWMPLPELPEEVLP